MGGRGWGEGRPPAAAGGEDLATTPKHKKDKFTLITIYTFVQNPHIRIKLTLYTVYTFCYNTHK